MPMRSHERPSGRGKKPSRASPGKTRNQIDDEPAKPRKPRFIAEHEVHPFLIARLARIEWPEVVEVNVRDLRWVDIEGILGYTTRIGLDEERKCIRMTGLIPVSETSASAGARQALCNRIMRDLAIVQCLVDQDDPDIIIVRCELPYQGGISRDALLHCIGIVAIAIPMSLNYQDHDKLTRWNDWY
jgi:hypothetical protein